MSSDPTITKPKKKRVRKQKTEEEQEQQYEQQLQEEEEAAAAEAEAEPEPVKKKVKREANEDAEDDANMTADGEDGANASNDNVQPSTAIAGGGYLSQETLNYYKQLAAVLDADEFENEEDKLMFLSNVVEELCGTEAGKLRASSRRALAGEAEDISQVNQANNTNFVLQRLCSHAKCSRLVQKIMEIANPEQVSMFLTALRENVVDVLADRYGSHVLEAVFFRMPSLLANEAAALETTKDESVKASTLANQRTSTAWKNLGTHSRTSIEGSGPNEKATPLRAHFFALVVRMIGDGQWLALSKDAHASFSIRHVIHILAGETNIKALSDGTTSSKTNSSAPTVATSIPSYLSGLEELLPWMTQEISNTELDELEEAARSSSAVPVLQSLMRAVDKSARAVGEQAIRIHLQVLMAKLLQFKGDQSQWTPEAVSQPTKNTVHVLLCDRSGSRLLETICSLGGVNIVSALFNCHMAGRLLQLAQHQIANFALQHVLQSVRRNWSSRGRHLLRTAYEELSPHIEELCAASRTGVVLQLLDACVRVQVKENKIFKLIASLAVASFEEQTPINSNVVGAILLTPLLKSSSSSDATSISVIGSLIIQSCLQPAHGLQPTDPSDTPSDDAKTLAATLPFQTVLNAFLQLPPEFILQLALDGTGSHIFDAFVEAPCAINVKQQLFRRFQMKWVELSMSSSGSYVLERLFSIAPNQLKIGIAGDLCRAEKRVLGSRSGAVVFRKLRLEHYKRHQQSWLTSRDAARERATQLFADVIGDSTAESETGKEKESKSNKKSATKKSEK